jgi:hypothetical protein
MEVIMPLHASTRRELLLGSGALFAWAYVPRIARAEGRDPRLLTIVLRGALDGLAASRRLAILTGSSCAATMRQSTATRRRCRSTVSASTRRCRTSTASTRRAGDDRSRGGAPYRERSHFDVGTRPKRPRGGARRERPVNQRWWYWARRRRSADGDAWVGRSRRWWYAAGRRCCHGCRREAPR